MATETCRTCEHFNPHTRLCQYQESKVHWEEVDPAGGCMWGDGPGEPNAWEPRKPTTNEKRSRQERDEARATAYTLADVLVQLWIEAGVVSKGQRRAKVRDLLGDTIRRLRGDGVGSTPYWPPEGE